MSQEQGTDRHPNFSRSFFGGYSTAEVDEFVEKMLVNIQELREENAAIRNSNTQLTKEIELRKKSSFWMLNQKIEETQAQLAALRELAVKDVTSFLHHLQPEALWKLLQKVPIDQQVVALHVMGDVSETLFPLIPTSHKKDLILALSKTERLSTEEVRRVLALLQVPLEQEIEQSTFLACDQTMYISILDSEANPHELLNSIRTVDRKLGTQLREDVILFSDVLHLDYINMNMLLRQTDLYDWVQVVKNGSEDLLNLVLSGMSRRMGEEFQEDLDDTRTVHPVHLQESQLRIVQELRAQIESGHIVLVRPK